MESVPSQWNIDRHNIRLPRYLILNHEALITVLYNIHPNIFYLNEERIDDMKRGVLVN